MVRITEERTVGDYTVVDQFWDEHEAIEVIEAAGFCFFSCDERPGNLVVGVIGMDGNRIGLEMRVEEARELLKGLELVVLEAEAAMGVVQERGE